jgi:CRISPR-associated protein Cas2
MATREHHILASYDISDPKRLVKVGKIMKNYGERVLKSVFECNLGEARFQQMKQRIDKVIDHMEDTVRYYFVCEKCASAVEISGLGEGFAADSEVFIG